MRFSFKKHYRFICSHCTLCCHQENLSITEGDYQRLIKLSKGEFKARKIKNELFSYLISPKGKCPFLTYNKLCRVYSDRPVVCRLIPLALGYFPTGELCINVIRCPGVNYDRGLIIDENFVIKIIDEIEAIEPNYFSRLKNYETSIYSNPINLFTHYNYTGFKSKRMFLINFVKWLFSDNFQGKSMASRCFTLSRVLMKSLINKREGIFSEFEVRKEIQDIERNLSKNIDSILEGASKQYQTNFGESIMKRLQSERKLDKMIDFPIQTDKTIKINLKDLLHEKDLEFEAETTLREYFHEIMNRVGQSGFINTPLTVVLASLRPFSNTLDIYFRFFSRKEEKITKSSIELSIQRLDGYTPLLSKVMIKNLYN
jgi:Fe-S-cluster containining protein